MNQGRIWTVVNSTVGLPLFLGAVALTSVGVHTAVLSNTTWMKAYWQGSAPAKAAANTAVKPAAYINSTSAKAYVVHVSPASHPGLRLALDTLSRS